MTPYYTDDAVTLWHGDCIDVLATLPDASVDAVVTDPPYGLEFMGKEWDRPWSGRGDQPAGASMTTGGFAANNGYADRKTPAYGKPWTLKRCAKCGHCQAGGSPCDCADPVWVVERQHPAVTMRAFGAWCELWAAECLRVLKPGGHMLTFGGTRTWHRLACAVEDAGFEVRDSIAWLYGSGFSKSWNFDTMYAGKWCECGNAIPLSHAGDADMHGLRKVIPATEVPCGASEGTDLFAEMQRSEPGPGLGEARTQGPGGVDPRSGTVSAGEDERRTQPVVAGRQLHRTSQGISDGPRAAASAGTGERVRSRASVGNGRDDRAAGDTARRGASHQRRPSGQQTGEPETVPGPHDALDGRAFRDGPICSRCGGLDPVYTGFGTGLKPAHEPIVVARKPLTGTVAANVLAYGTGALNIDACRVAAGQDYRDKCASVVGLDSNRNGAAYGDWTGVREDSAHAAGRWPANVVLDDVQAAELDQQSGTLTSGSRNAGGDRRTDETDWRFRGGAREGDSGGASRFFPVFRYEAKAPTTERPRLEDGTAHATVKPLDLMRWLVRLVTPPGGTVLDPFLGSGTTAEACIVEGFRCIGIERDETYLRLATARLSKPIAPVLFGDGTA